MTDNEIYLRQKRAKEFQRKQEEQMKNENCEEKSTCLPGFKLPTISKISSKALHNIHCDDNDVPWKGKTLLDNGSKKAKKNNQAYP